MNHHLLSIICELIVTQSGKRIKKEFFLHIVKDQKNNQNYQFIQIFTKRFPQITQLPQIAYAKIGCRNS